MSLATIKATIKSHLDTLVTADVLVGASISDVDQNPLNHNEVLYPHAFLMSPSTEAELNDNRTIIRSYTFDIVVLFRAEDLASTTEIETAIETMLAEFDNDPTLGGYAPAGIPPTSSSPAPLQHNGADLIMVVLQVVAKDLVTLTYA